MRAGSFRLDWRRGSPAGDVRVDFTIAVDALTAMMLVDGHVRLAAGSPIFSIGYMHGDQGYARFFAVMGLFVFSMTGLVLATTSCCSIAFWEGVGLCSYLLIGFWFEKPSAAAAARKAFLVNAIGDVGFVLGIFLLWSDGPDSSTYDGVFEHVRRTTGDPRTRRLTVLACCSSARAAGKSAQFPLHVWLPDAMEGPTPVSAPSSTPRRW